MVYTKYIKYKKGTPKRGAWNKEMKKHTKKELKDMLNNEYGESHKGEKIIDIYSFIIASGKEYIKVILWAPDTHTIYKETYTYNPSTQVFDFVRVDGIL